MQKSGKLVLLFTAVVLALPLAGCSVKLKTGDLEAVENSLQEQLAVCDKAEKMKNEVGYGSFTLFAIPVAKVTVEGDARKEMARVIKETVEHAGYETVVVEKPSDSPDIPTIEVCVNKCFFYNYTWLAPIVFNWGNIEMKVTVKDPQGKTLWKKDYKGAGMGLYDFDPTFNMALNKILNQLAFDITSPEFQEAVFGAQTSE